MESKHFFDINDLSQGIPRQLAEGLDTRIFVGTNVMVSVVRVEPGALGKPHAHTQEQWGYLVEGSGIRIQDNVDHPVKKGDLWLTPGGIMHGFRGGPDGAVILDIFSPPRPEYRKPGTGFGDE